MISSRANNKMKDRIGVVERIGQIEDGRYSRGAEDAYRN